MKSQVLFSSTDKSKKLKCHLLQFLCGALRIYGSLPKSSNTLNIRTPKIIAKYNFKMFPKISNSGQFSEIEFLKFRTVSFFAKKRVFHTFYPSLLP